MTIICAPGPPSDHEKIPEEQVIKAQESHEVHVCKHLCAHIMWDRYCDDD